MEAVVECAMKKPAGAASMAVDESTTQPNDSHRRYTLYLIRHGEAFHNVQEKLAEKQAQVDGQAQGLSDVEIKLKVDLARQRVLQDPAFFDSPLTAHGINQAHEASTKLYAMEDQFPFPTEVFVSPLQRTLSTAAHLFVPEDHASIRVREELRERLTGRPADNRYSSSVLASRKSFARFSFKNLQRNSMQNLERERIGDEHDHSDGCESGNDSLDSDMLSTLQDLGNVYLSMTEDEDLPEQRTEHDKGDGDGIGIGLDIDADSPIHQQRSKRVDWQLPNMESNSSIPSTSSILSSSNNVEHCMELEPDMEIRAGKLLEILCGSESTSVAVLSHKAYLRALERGVFGHADATEFDNCEIRVYSVVLDKVTKSLLTAKRML